MCACGHVERECTPGNVKSTKLVVLMVFLFSRSFANIVQFPISVVGPTGLSFSCFFLVFVRLKVLRVFNCTCFCFLPFFSFHWCTVALAITES